jgi:excisionase family DNA binding protein
MMVKGLMNTKEIATYLGINEKQVYQLIKKGKIPATRVTGKWLFPKRIVDEWIETTARQNLGSKSLTLPLDDQIIILGSNDLILDFLLVRLRERFPESIILSGNIGSMAGLQALKKGKAHVVGAHLLDPRSGQYNLPFIKGERVIIVNLAYRQQGILVYPGNPLKIQGLEDLVDKPVRFINRQKGSGTRLLLEIYLEQLKISPTKIQGYQREVVTHLEVGLEILRGKADAGIGLFSIAKYLGLDFIPLTKERFDLLIPNDYFFLPQIQYLIEILGSLDYRAKAAELGGYDTNESGKIVQ